MAPEAAARRPELAVLVSLSGEGGVERMVLNLVEELAGLLPRLDLVLIRDESSHPRALPDTVRIVRLGTRHSALSVWPLSRYLRRERPRVVLAAKDRAGRAALLARWLAGVDARVYIRLGTTLSQALEGQPAPRRVARYLPMRLLYRWVDGVVAVSEGVAEDTRAITGLPAGRVHVIRNPVVGRALPELARAPVPHPWLEAGEVPVVMGIGRLTRQKDFPTLLRAFARVRAERPCRLIVLGEGKDRPALTALARELSLEPEVAFVGFQSNPYAWLGRASLFVLSSAWEGSPNALTEALALGVPVVSTDCRSGPREVLQGGRVAPLVPVGDVPALAAAMRATLAAPPPADALRAAVAEYTVERSARRYLEVLGR